MSYNVISLGSFCSVASFLNDLHLRKKSYPFDWIISESFESVLKLIDNKFKNFIDFNNLFQYSTNKSYYYDKLNLIHFYHDFDNIMPLKYQLYFVRKKYKRRIKRFYKTLKKPTIFIRYLTKNDINFVNTNYKNIESFFKSYNKNNFIIYVSNYPINSNIKFSFLLEKDKNDTVTRNLNVSTLLKQFLIQNGEQVFTKPKKKHQITYKALRKFYILCTEKKIYYHSKTDLEK